MNNSGKLLVLLFLILWIIAPDPIPGPIDDVIMAVIAVAESRGLKANN